MAVNDLERKLEELSSGESNWKEGVEARRKNTDWLKHSRKIAIKIVRFLKENKIKQKELAEKLGVSAQQVSKIVKGKENLTLETIAKIEKVLDIQILNISYKTKTKTVQFSSTEKHSFSSSLRGNYNESAPIGKIIKLDRRKNNYNNTSNG